jgi:hypothetical protein
MHDVTRACSGELVKTCWLGFFSVPPRVWYNRGIKIGLLRLVVWVNERLYKIDKRLVVNIALHLTTRSSASVMECLHCNAAASTTTKNGTFWFCGEKPSCEFFCPEEDCYMYTRAVAAFCASGSIHPVCPTHQKFARLCVV